MILLNLESLKDSPVGSNIDLFNFKTIFICANSSVEKSIGILKNFEII